jgi:ABC-type nickel/cobalt efflux system permease component RcnA
MRRVSPLVRNLAILALIALAIVLLNQETALATASQLLRVAFVLAIAVAIYMLWRDFGRREIQLWSGRQQGVFYGAAALLTVDVIWFLWWGPNGRDALAGIVVGAISVYVGVRTWRSHRGSY